MNLKQLVALVKWSDVKKSLMYFYPDQRKSLAGYKKVFDIISSLKDVKTDSKEYIKCERSTDDSDKNYDYYSTFTNKYSLSFRPWSEVASLRIRQDNLLNHQLVALILWEMTYSGFTNEDCQKEGEKLFKIAREAKIQLQNNKI